MTDAEQSPDQTGAQSGAQSASVHVQRTVSAPVEKVWQTLISSEGTQALLGPGAELGSKGESWHSGDGPHGVVRSYHPMEQLRVSWHADDDAPPSLVDLHLVPQDGGTRLDLVHEKLSDGDDPQHLRARWDDALERLASSVTG